MSWSIVADSSCNLRSYEPRAAHTVFHIAPLTITVGDTDYVDDAHLDVPAFHQAMTNHAEASSSSCPSAGVWAEYFREADNVIAITISGHLSGSYDAACMARNMVLDDWMRDHDGIMTGKNIFVLDSRAAGGKLEVLVQLLDTYLAEHPACAFEEAVDYIKRLEEHSQVLFSLSSYENLVKNGRMPRLAGTLATKLNIRVLGIASAEGTIKMVGPTRGEKKTYNKVVDSMASCGYNGGLAYIDHVENPTAAADLRTAILQRWTQASVEILPCGALCSYYAEQSGLIIGFEWLS